MDIELVRSIYRRMGQDYDARGWSVGRVFVTTHARYYRAIHGLMQIREYCEAIREQRPMRHIPEMVPRHRLVKRT